MRESINTYHKLLAAFLLLAVSSLMVSYSHTYTQEPADNKPLIPTIVSKITTATPTPPQAPLPTSHSIQGGTHSFQSFNNCGPASLAMALSFYDVFIAQDVLGRELRPWQNPQGDNDDKSVTLAELADKAEELGFVSYHRPGGNIEKLKAFIAQDIPVVTRTLTKTSEDIGHYRVIYGYDEAKGVIYQNDSLQGKGLAYTYDEFLSLWQPYAYEYMVFVSSEKTAIAEQILKQEVDETTAWENVITRLEREKATALNPSLVTFALSVAQYHTGDYQKSVELYESVEAALPFRTLWYQIEPLEAYYEIGRYETVLSKSQAILQNQNRAYSELYVLRSKVYLAQNNPDAAREELRNAILYNENYQEAKDLYEGLN